MSSLTLKEARDEILALVQAAWEANVPNSEPLLWDGLRVDPQIGDHAVLEFRHVAGNQATLGETAHYDRIGLVLVRIKTKTGKGLGASATLAQIALNALEGQKTAGGVWFRDVQPNDEGRDGEWFVTIVSAEANYSQVK